MSSLKILEFQRLFKELQFVESDYNYQSEILKQYESKFFESVNCVLQDHPELKKIWTEQLTKQEEIKINQEIGKVEIESSPKKLVPDVQVKRIYREVAKHTHPDRIKNLKLNELYLEATAAYEVNDIVNLFKVCNELNIEVDWSDDIFSKIRDRINLFKNRILFLESTFTFKWLKTSNEDEKNRIVLNFIENKIR
jgi:hypothetical protein